MTKRFITNKLTLAGLLALAASQPALADSGTWTGCYAGLNTGYSWSEIEGTSLRDDVYVFENARIGSADADGGAFGGQVGCDHQAGTWVFGARLAMQFADAEGSHQYIDGTTPADRVHYDVKNFGSLTARAGYLLKPETLGYVKAGLAWAKTRHKDADPQAEPPYSGSVELDRSGWTLGVGLEQRLQKNLSLFVEYNYMDFGEDKGRIHYNDGSTYKYAFDQDTSYLSLGLNYRF